MTTDMTEPATKKPREEAAPDGEKDVIMVTGGSGLVGQAIRMYVESNKKDNEEWIYLSSKDGDLRVRSDTDAIFAKYKPTHVIHLAAKVGGLFANMAQKVGGNVASCRPLRRLFVLRVVRSSQLLNRIWKRPVFRADHSCLLVSGSLSCSDPMPFLFNTEMEYNGVADHAAQRLSKAKSLFARSLLASIN